MNTKTRADYNKPIESTTKRGQGDLNEIFANFFGGNSNLSGIAENLPSRATKNYKVELNEDGSNTILINATGYPKEVISIEVVDNELVITTPSLKQTTEISFIPIIDYKFSLGDTFDENGITALIKNGVLNITVNKKEKVEPIKKVIKIE